MSESSCGEVRVREIGIGVQGVDVDIVPIHREIHLVVSGKIAGTVCRQGLSVQFRVTFRVPVHPYTHLLTLGNLYVGLRPGRL